MVAIDAKRAGNGMDGPHWEIYTHGGRRGTGLDAIEWARKMVDHGAGEILLTSMDRDGTREGFDLTGRQHCFYRKLTDGEWRAVDPVIKNPELIYGRQP